MTTSSTSPRPALLRAAFVRRAHGVRGEVRVEPLGGDASRFGAGLLLVRESDGRAFRVRAARNGSEGDVLLALEGVDDRDAAAALRSAYLCVAAGERRLLGDGEWFVYELVGLRVRTVAGEALGTVRDVEEYPEQSVLVIDGPNGGLTRMPLVRAFVQRIDVASGVLEVTPWPDDAEAAP